MRRIPLVCLLCLAVSVSAADARKAALEKKELDAIAKVFLEQATFLVEHSLPDEAKKALDRAAAAGAADKDRQSIEEKLAGLTEGKADSNVTGRLRRDAAAAARHYDRLAKLERNGPAAVRYQLTAVALDPTSGRVGAMLSEAQKAPPESAGLILEQLREADPAGAEKGRYDAIEAKLAERDVCLLKAPSQPLVGYLSLPRDWKRNKTYPVLVAVDGAGSNFLGACRGFAKGRGKRDYIVLAPCSLSNTNELKPKKYPFYDARTLQEGGRNRIEFDLAGLQALLEVVRTRFGGAQKIGITGFSGGGNLCYAMTARHPEEIAFSAPACPNFCGLGFGDAKAVQGGGPLVHVFTGEKDPHRFLEFGKTPPGIEEQTDHAIAALKQLGFTHIERTMLPGVGHSSCNKQVWEVADAAAKSR